jgi:hypothetical protein
VNISTVIESEEEIKAMFACVDCKGCTYDNDEYYMVHDDLWQTAGMDQGMLCIGCLETRLGRRLDSRDFTHYPINTSPAFKRSERLKSRLGITTALFCL